MNARTKGRRGFTLLEVLLVIFILGLLATVGIVAYSGIREGAKIDTTKLKLKEIQTALDTFNLQIGRYPTAEEGLKVLLSKPEDEKEAEKWRAPYLKEEPKDAWGREYHYEPVEAGAVEGATKAYKLWSDGPDGQSETDDDIKSWSDNEEK